jgi:hypothetical protein
MVNKHARQAKMIPSAIANAKHFQMNSPDFLIIGAQKSGTSWLHRQLRQHPGIFMPADKDAPFFFNDQNETLEFLKRFDNAPAGTMVGDACASYFWTRNSGPYPKQFNHDISAAIRRHLGDKLKLIVMLRHPVQRSVSAYLHHIAHGSLNMDCKILEAPPEIGIVSLSQYRQHLKHWQQDYPANQLLVLPAPESKNTAAILNSSSDFLSLTAGSYFQKSEEKVFEGLKRKITDDGIWVALNGSDSAVNGRANHLPWTDIDGERFYRLIQTSELQLLEQALVEDIALYRTLFPDDLSELTV